MHEQHEYLFYEWSERNIIYDTYIIFLGLHICMIPIGIERQVSIIYYFHK